VAQTAYLQKSNQQSQPYKQLVFVQLAIIVWLNSFTGSRIGFGMT